MRPHRCTQRSRRRAKNPSAPPAGALFRATIYVAFPATGHTASLDSRTRWSCWPHRIDRPRAGRAELPLQGRRAAGGAKPEKAITSDAAHRASRALSSAVRSPARQSPNRPERRPAFSRTRTTGVGPDRRTSKSSRAISKSRFGAQAIIAFGAAANELAAKLVRRAAAFGADFATPAAGARLLCGTNRD